MRSLFSLLLCTAGVNLFLYLGINLGLLQIWYQ